MRLSLVLALLASVHALADSHVPRSAALPLGLYKHLAQQAAERRLAAPAHAATAQHAFAAPSSAPSARTFTQRVSHLAEFPSNDTFEQRYWFDDQHYVSGGPVFLLDGGETDGEGRLPFLQQGILAILAQATSGVGIILEHRYYGQSFPTANLTTDSMRFLTSMQALHDNAHFASTLVLPGRLASVNLTAAAVPWIIIGGSYAGAQSAFSRLVFPDVFWGSIASSAVTTAIVDFWEYYEPIRQSAPAACIETLLSHTTTIDTLLALKNSYVTSSLKSYFGLGNVTQDDDFVNALSMPLGLWQSKNWDPTVGGDVQFDEYCAALALDGGKKASLFPGDPRNRFEHYATYVKSKIASLCPPSMTQDECFGTQDVVFGDSLEEAPWRSWTWQYCTEWGYFIGAAPEGNPSLVSSLLTNEYASRICREAFPAGELVSVPNVPDVHSINRHGSFDVSASRLAFIDGSSDPWLYACPHSPNAAHGGVRGDTLRRPFKLIEGGVHHWDENGADHEPSKIRAIHAQEVEFVQRWLSEWRERGRWHTKDCKGCRA